MTMDSRDELDYHWMVLDFFLSACYFVLFAVSAVEFHLINKRSSPASKWNTQKLFLILICGQTFCRCLYFSLDGARHLQLEANRSFVSVMGTIPAIIYFTTFTVLVYFWAQLYHFAHGQRSYYVGPICIIVNVLFYFSTLAFYCASSVFPDIDSVYASSVAYIHVVGVYSLGIALAFLVYGWRLYVMFGSIAHVTGLGTKGAQMVRQVGLVTLISLCCFTARAIFIFIFTVKISHNISISLPYFLISEIIPSVLMLYIFRKTPDSEGAEHHNSLYHSSFRRNYPSYSTIGTYSSTVVSSPYEHDGGNGSRS
eukprot:Nk52_evm19s2192 gene=Nk52_evmTU19s2192